MKNEMMFDEIVIVEEGFSSDGDITQSNVSVMCGVNNSHRIRSQELDERDERKTIKK